MPSIMPMPRPTAPPPKPMGMPVMAPVGGMPKPVGMPMPMGAPQPMPQGMPMPMAPGMPQQMAPTVYAGGGAPMPLTGSPQPPPGVPPGYVHVPDPFGGGPGGWVAPGTPPNPQGGDFVYQPPPGPTQPPNPNLILNATASGQPTYAGGGAPMPATNTIGQQPVMPPTNTIAPIPQTPAPTMAPPPPAPYQGVPIVVGGSSNPYGSTAAIDQLMAMGTGPIDTSYLDASLAAMEQEQARVAASQGANAASAAFGAGAGGTPVMNVANDAVAGVLSTFGNTAAQTSLNFYNQQSANQLAALGQAGQLGLGYGNLDLNAQMAQQNALFGAESAGLARENQTFNQGIASGAQSAQMFGQLMDMGTIPQNMEQAQLDALYQEFNRQYQAGMDPIALITQLMGGAPITQTPPTIFDPTTGLVLGGAAAGGAMAPKPPAQAAYRPPDYSHPGVPYANPA